jgi:hypothetical protein
MSSKIEGLETADNDTRLRVVIRKADIGVAGVCYLVRHLGLKERKEKKRKEKQRHLGKTRSEHRKNEDKYTTRRTDIFAILILVTWLWHT